VSAVVMGQALTKLVQSVVGRSNIVRDNFILVFAFILVFGLVPTLILLSIVLTTPKVTAALAVIQAVAFVFSVLLFWLACAVEGSFRPREK
jgi:hypothetical protein